MTKYGKSYSSFSEQKSFKPNKKPLFGAKKQAANKPLSSRIIFPESNIRSRPLYSNPKAEKNWRKIILVCLLLISLISWLSIMLYHPYFQINKISVSGLQTISFNDIHDYLMNKYLRKKIIPTNNYFLVRAGMIRSDLLSRYALESAAVEKVFPGLLSVNVKEKIVTIVYDNGSSYSLLDNQGTVVKIISVYNEPVITLNETMSATNTPAMTTSTTSTTEAVMQKHKPDLSLLASEYFELPVFYDERKITVQDKKTNIVPPNVINFMIDWQAAIRNEGIGEVRYFESDNISAGISVYLNKPWKILVQPDNSLNAQLSNLKILLSSRDVKPAEYIDLRFGERVFWK